MSFEAANDDSTSAQSKRRKRGPRFREIAIEAGLSETTVDRVLNERGSVSAQARERVVAAALKLGVPRTLPDLRHGLMHVDVVLPRNTSPMFQRLELALQRAIRLLDRHIVVHRITLERNNDAAFARAIMAPPYRRAGLIVVGSMHVATLDALRWVIDRGEPVAAMVTALPGAYYTGIDNAMAGRTAGHMIGKLTRGSGRVLVLRGLNDYPAHDERVAGCIAALRAAHPEQAVIVAPGETNDDPDICYRLVSQAVRQGSIAAIYNTGDGATGVYKALRRLQLRGQVVWVGHEMQDAHAQYLEEDCLDLVIDQDPDAQAYAALHHLLVACGERKPIVDVKVGEFALFTKPNARRGPYLA